MKVGHTEEEMILDGDKEKKDDVINGEEVYCTGVCWSIRESWPVDIL